MLLLKYVIIYIYIYIREILGGVHPPKVVFRVKSQKVVFRKYPDFQLFIAFLGHIWAKISQKTHNLSINQQKQCYFIGNFNKFSKKCPNFREKIHFFPFRRLRRRKVVFRSSNLNPKSGLCAPPAPHPKNIYDI